MSNTFICEKGLEAQSVMETLKPRHHSIRPHAPRSRKLIGLSSRGDQAKAWFVTVEDAVELPISAGHCAWLGDSGFTI